MPPSNSFWSKSSDEIIKSLSSGTGGLTSAESQKRLLQYGKNTIKQRRETTTISLFLKQFKSPIIIILLLAAILSFFLSDKIDSIIIFVIVMVSSLLSFFQEKGATNAVSKLLSLVQVKTAVLRDGNKTEIPVEDVVPGDIVLLSAGDIIPGDGLLIEETDFFVNESSLTGETFPAEKQIGILPADTALAKRTNCIFMGTSVTSGTAKAIIVQTGLNTQFGEVSKSLKQAQPETEFETGIRKFGYLLMEVTLVLLICIFAINVFLHRPLFDAFMFSLAIAVGLTPQLLPAIISVNLSYGARKMAANKVIVKKLNSIENFGSMNVFCSDKTGTLTQGTVHLNACLDVNGNASDRVQLMAYLNASFETGFSSPIDEAIRKTKTYDISAYQKTDEVPYDFIRKRLTIAVSKADDDFMISKGALKNILEVCTQAETPNGNVPLEQEQATIQSIFEKMCGEGFRILGVAYKKLNAGQLISKSDETGMIFLGFIALNDPPKEGIIQTLQNLKILGIQMKMITGDNPLVASHVAGLIGMDNTEVLSGSDLNAMSDEALVHRVNKVCVYAEVEPNQKQRIIRSLIRAGNVVGYMGDGINDASAIHAADVGISVNTAVDVAKEAADIVLLEENLDVLVNGVREGRKTFANTLKYVFMATSANFGNMFSMAGASLFLPFLPLLPTQILLINLLTDLPEMTIASDRVDDELVVKPRRWNIQFIRNFMIVFGLISSVFDYCTFGVLLWMLHTDAAHFRTGWFIESVVSASLIVLVVRTRKPFFKSKPGKFLLITTLCVAIFTMLMPFTGLAHLFGFTAIPVYFYFILIAIIAFYVLSAEVAKRFFYKMNLKTQ